MARFPVDQFETVKELLKSMNFCYSNKISVFEIEGKHVFTFYDSSARKSYSFCLRRKNGEPCWNICQTCIFRYHNTPDDVLLKIFASLKEKGIDLSLPKVNFEYIPPISTEEADKFRHPDYERAWCPVDSFDIEKAQEFEKGWYEDAIAKGVYKKYE
jgi:hypothetical protein